MSTANGGQLLFSQIANTQYRLSAPGPSPYLRANSPVHVCMGSIQEALGNWAHPWFISHIRSHSKLPGILEEGNGRAGALIMTVDMQLPEQARMLHQQYHLFPQNFHKLLPELPISQRKHLARSCTTCMKRVHLLHHCGLLAE